MNWWIYENLWFNCLILVFGGGDDHMVVGKHWDFRLERMLWELWFLAICWGSIFWVVERGCDVGSGNVWLGVLAWKGQVLRG